MAAVWHKKGDNFDGDQWELYNLDEDFSQSNNLAQKHPDKLKALRQLWWAEAGKYGVLPLDDRRWERLADTTRPKASLPKDSYTYYPGTSPVPVVAAPRVLNRSHRITAEVDIPASGAEGVLLCLGTEFGGWSLYVKDRRLVYAHNYLQIQEFNLKSTTDVPEGKATLAYEFTKTGENVGTGRLFINGKPVGELVGIKTACAGRQGRAPLRSSSQQETEKNKSSPETNSPKGKNEGINGRVWSPPCWTSSGVSTPTPCWRPNAGACSPSS